MLALTIAAVLLMLCARGAAGLLSKAAPALQPLDAFVYGTCAGLMWTAWAVLLLSFFAPLQPFALSVLGAGALLSLRGARPRLEARPALLIFASLAVAGCGTVALYDSGLYHLQMISMLRDYGTVPGAALVHHRFSFTSAWFALAASLEPGVLAGRMAAVPNVVLFAVATLHFVSAVASIAQGKSEHSSWYLAAAYPVVFYRAMIDTEPVSPSPHPAMAIAAVLAGWLLIRDPSAGRRPSMVLLAGAASLKLAALPAAAVLALSDRLRPRSSLLLAAGVLPLLLGNYRASGCPLFPSSLCVPSAHTLSAEKAAEVDNETMNWARYVGFYPSDAGRFEVRWIPRWLARTDPVILAVLVAAAAVLIRRRVANLAVAAGASGTLFVLVTAPDSRFYYGYVAVLAGAAAATFAKPLHLPRAVPRSPVAWAAAAMCTWLVYAGIREFVAGGPHTAELPAQLVIPPPVPAVPAGASSGPWSRPAYGDQCWNLPFPCAPYEVEAGVRPCDTTRGTRAGFCR